MARDSEHDLYSYSDRYVSSPAHDYSKIANIRKQLHVPIDELYYCCRRLLRFPITTGLGDYMALPPQYLERLYASACGEILGIVCATHSLMNYRCCCRSLPKMDRCHSRKLSPSYY